jgi:hypothetical protein
MFKAYGFQRRDRITVVRLLWILFAWRIVVAMEVFHDVGKVSSLFAMNRTTCLATDALRISNSRRNAYPLDLFGEISFPADNYSCFLQPPRLRQETHSCSHSHYLCPVKEEYIPLTMTAFENASSQICQTFKALERLTNNEPSSLNPPVNVIIVGGSVTGGAYAAGCMKGTCSPPEQAKYAPCGHYDCTWQHGVVNYLENRFGKKTDHHRLQVLDLCMGGTTSCTLLHILVQKLEAKNVTLSSRDLLLYDYSVNDGLGFQDSDQFQRLRQCMEGVLEKIVHYSTDGLPPTILFLEYHPFRFFDVKGKSPDPTTYTRIYHEVARKFHLPIISYRDLFWHPLFRADLKQYPKFEHIVEYKWAEPGVLDIHPPWIVHDVYADVIAGVLDLTYQLCNHKNNKNSPNTTTIKPLIEIDLDPWATFRNSRGVVPDTVLLSEDAATANASYLTPEQASHLPYGWNLYQDRLKKPGWIIEGKVNEKTPLSSRTLTFSEPYNITFSSSASIFATLEVAFMQTYRNAGAFRVEVCGTAVSTWPEHSHIVDTLIENHFSNLDVVVFKLDLKLSRSCKENSVIEMKVIHENLGDKLEMRGTQKVKISSVRMVVSKSTPSAATSPRNMGTTTTIAGTGHQISVLLILLVIGVVVVFIGFRIWKNYSSVSTTNVSSQNQNILDTGPLKTDSQRY